ncbi:MAG: bifunctional oligoribonuclease/PAP phosphatase NrnA, partial [Synergistaceae bacterium]|nr:bifunctional oligoribonuclease/PAP phosphatase NrnA [Synergistaceae bacterium]
QPDGDTLGCASALLVYGQRMGKAVRWAGPDPIPESYAFLPGADRYEPMREISVPGDFLPIYLDTSNPERTLRVVGMPERSAVNIDHHGDNARFASVNFVDPSAGATAELAWEILARLGKPVETSSAIGLYAGLVTDTGRFGYSCTTPRSHRIAAELLEKGIQPELMDRLLYSNWTPQALRLRGRAFSRLDYEPERGIALTWLTRSDFEDTGADLSETEGLASDLLRIRNSRFSAVLIENETSVRVSLRSRGKISAAEIAHRHGGGGHPNAAGMRLPLPLEASLAALKAEILNDND